MIRTMLHPNKALQWVFNNISRYNDDSLSWRLFAECFYFFLFPLPIPFDRKVIEKLAQLSSQKIHRPKKLSDICVIDSDKVPMITNAWVVVKHKILCCRRAAKVFAFAKRFMWEKSGIKATSTMRIVRMGEMMWLWIVIFMLLIFSPQLTRLRVWMQDEGRLRRHRKFDLWQFNENAFKPHEFQPRNIYF